MTIASTAIRADYTASGIAGPYTFPFCLFNILDLQVITTDLSGVDDILTYGSDYTAVGIKAANDFTEGGTVTFASAVTSGYHIALISNVDGTQPASIKNNTDYYAYLHENEFDRLAIADLQNFEALQRAILAPKSEPDSATLTLPSAANRALKLLGFDANGDLAAYTNNQLSCIPYSGASTNADLNSKNLTNIGHLESTSFTATDIQGDTIVAQDHLQLKAGSSTINIYGSNGVPNNAVGNDGDFCLRYDGTVGSNIYKKVTGAWSAIL